MNELSKLSITASDAETCSSCKFCHETKSDVEIGRSEMICKRMPPQVVVLPVQTPVGPRPQCLGFQPPVSAETTCGEWKPRLPTLVS